jgi:hypothetical protein
MPAFWHLELDMPLFSDDLLIKADGTIDEAYVASAAALCAKSRYGFEASPGDVAYYVEILSGRALILRTRRLRELGLPADPTVSITAFGPVREGVRRSAF